jgi:epoxyqueuosine reductase
MSLCMSLSRENIFRSIVKRGYQIRTVSIEHLPTLQTEIEGRNQQGEFDKDFYMERLVWFDFRPPKHLAYPRSIIVVAVPRPQTQAAFILGGRRKALYLPPTYTAYDEITQAVESLVSSTLQKSGYQTASTAVPLKLLAARSGLAQYGKNNICYVHGMGSYLQLVAVYSDMPCHQDDWQEPSLMPECSTCERCGKACPTKAISSDRFLLHAERCIVFHNERPGEVPFPKWMKPSWHNCIVGCFYCQRVCPVNKEYLQFTGEQEEFSELETTLILGGKGAEGLPAETMAKLKRLSLDEYLGVLPRNLSVFFANTTSEPDAQSGR